MKKLISLFLSAVMSIGIILSLAGCVTSPTPTPNPLTEPELDTAEIFEDNFNKIDYTVWNIMNTRWGGKHHGGVIRENVGYTKEGHLVFTGNGDYYNGSVLDIDGKVGRRTGGAIVTHRTFGPGVFTARMKALPRFGATTAFWTYFNDGVTLNDRGQVYNSEIDFELNVDTFDTTMCTNWTGVPTGNFDNRKVITDVYHNDGKWHEYTFKWMTAPLRIEYYLDNALISTSVDNVPTYAAQANLGLWFAGFAGTPDFETDYMMVDYFKYTPYKKQPYEEIKQGTPPPNDVGYPQAPMTIPAKVNFVGDAGFEYPAYDNFEIALNAWYMYPGDKDELRKIADAKVKGAGVSGSVALVLEPYDRVTQTFTQVYPNFKIDFSAKVKHSATSSGSIIVQYLAGTDGILGDETILLNSSTSGFKANEFYDIAQLITVPEKLDGKKISRIRLRFLSDDKIGNQITIDDVFMNHITD